MCLHEWLHTSCSKVCRECGIERRMLRLDIYNVNSAPLERGYNRRQRYRTKVDKLLGLHSGPHCEDAIWIHLDKHRITLNTPFDVRECLRASSLKNKHYDSIRTFTDAFTTFRVDHNQIDDKRFLMNEFDALYSGWATCFEESFFSYAWLLRYFLEKRNSKLTVYLKPKTCKRRNAKYLQKIKAIRSQHSDETRSCARLKIHSRNEKAGSGPHRTQQYLLWRQAEKVLLAAGDGRSRNVANLLHVLRRRNSTSSDGSVS